jgi:hypothetical protein
MAKTGREFGTQQQVASHVRVPVEKHHFYARLQRLLHVEFDALCGIAKLWKLVNKFINFLNITVLCLVRVNTTGSRRKDE